MLRKIFKYSFILVVVFLCLHFFASDTKAEEKLYYIHSDHLGSTTVVTDEGGSVVSQQTYYPYGSTRGISEIKTSPTERQYTGQVSDIDQTGLYYYNARYYNPQIALFTQADTVNNDGLNRYFYVGGSPITYNDPTGHCKGWGCVKEFFEKLAQSPYAPTTLSEHGFRTMEDVEGWRQGTTQVATAVAPAAGGLALYAAASFVEVRTGLFGLAETVDTAACGLAGGDAGICVQMASLPSANTYWATKLDDVFDVSGSVARQSDELMEDALAVSQRGIGEASETLYRRTSRAEAEEILESGGLTRTRVQLEANGVRGLSDRNKNVTPDFDYMRRISTKKNFGGMSDPEAYGTLVTFDVTPGTINWLKNSKRIVTPPHRNFTVYGIKPQALDEFNERIIGIDVIPW